MTLVQSASRRLAAGLLALGLAACGGGEPDAPFSAPGTSADVAATQDAFDAPAIQSYATSSADMSWVVGFAVAAAPNAAVVSGDRVSAAQYARRLAARYQQASLQPSLSSARIPDEYLGKTFEYDAGADQYVQSARTGAPSNGVRFILYAVNPVTGEVVEPLNEIGYADITASETSTSIAVQVRVVSNGTTYLDYAITGSGSASSATISVSGYATNGTDRANFDLSTRLSGNASDGLTIDLDYVLEVPTRGFRIEMELTLRGGTEQESGSVEIDMEARGENGTVRLQGELGEAGGTLTVDVNGDRFATITVTASDEAVVTGAGGQALTAEEEETLELIFGIYAGGFAFFDDLTRPIN